MQSKEYVQKIADIYVEAGAQLTALANDPDLANDPEAWLPKADDILESVEQQVAALPTEVEA